MLLSKHCRPLGLQAPSRTAVVTYAQKGARKAARTKRSAKPASDVQLMSEYKAVKQATPTSNSVLVAEPVNGTSGSSSASSPQTAPSSSNGNGNGNPAPVSVAPTAGKKGFGRKGKIGGKGAAAAPAAPIPSAAAAAAAAPTAAITPAPTTSTSSSSSSSTVSASKAAGGASPVAAAATAQQPKAAAPPATAAADAPAAGAAAGAKVPTSPAEVKVAGARHEGFESTLTTKPPPAKLDDGSRDVEVSRRAPALESIEEVEARELLEDSLARLTVANGDVATAEEHVHGLATLLQDARSTLAALREDTATAQVGSEAENLLGIMTDLLEDLSGELELVGDHLVTTRDEISASQVQLEAAVAAGDEAAATHSLRQAADQNQQQLNKAEKAAAALAAAASATAAAEKRAAEALEAASAAEQKAAAVMEEANKRAAAATADAERKAQAAEQRAAAAAADAERRMAAAAAVSDRLAAEAAASEDDIAEATAASLQAATATVSALEKKAAAAVAAAYAAEEELEKVKVRVDVKEAEVLELQATSSNATSLEHIDRLRGVLVAQVQCNMTLLDKLGVLAQTVVGLPGLEPTDRVKLASTISQCVLAVGQVTVPEDLLVELDSSSSDDDSSSLSLNRKPSVSRR